MVKAIGRSPLRLFRTAALAIGTLTCAACGKLPEASLDEASVIGLAALAQVQPPDNAQIGWQPIEGLGIPVWLFYPAALDQLEAVPPTYRQAVPDDYITALQRRFGPVAAATLVAAPGHAVPDVMRADGTHSLLIFVPGAGLGGRDYRLFVEALAAQGHAVAVLRPLGSPGASAERYSEAAREIAAALDELRKMPDLQQGEARIDATRPVLIGHSLGGAAAVLAAAQTGVCAVNIDGDFGGESVAAAPTDPVLYIIADPARDRAADRARRQRVWGGVSGSSAHRALALGIAGMQHFDLADAAHLPPDIIPPDRRHGRFGPIGGADARRVLADLVVQFADYCAHDAKSPLASALQLPPEARPVFDPKRDPSSRAGDAPEIRARPSFPAGS